MRILHISEPHSEGVFTVLRHFVDEQRRHGHEVHVLSPPATPRLPGVTHHDWNIVRGDPRSYPRAVRQVRRLSRTLGPDVVHLHSFFAGLLGRLPVLRPATRPLVYQPHAWAFNVVTGVPRRVVARWEQWASRRTDAVVANCQDEIDEGRAQGVSVEAYIVRVAVDLDHFRPATAEERSATRTELGLAGRPVVLLPGRIAPQKGQDQMVTAWEEHPPAGIQLVLVGPGDSHALAESAPTTWGDSVRHVGATPDLRPWMWAADVVALPSRYEGFPLVAAEALATGTPVVATRFNGAEEAIETTQAGAAGPGGQVVDLLDMTAMLDACARRAQGSTQGPAPNNEADNARARALSFFEEEKMYEQLMAAYAAVTTTSERQHTR